MPTPDFYNDYIAHHGILGMKWGKKNGPPYPLSPGAHSQGEKKAGYKKSIGGGRNEEMYDRKKKKPDRHERAANASARDAEDLRKHGYTKEADAVQKVSDQQRAKSKTAEKQVDPRVRGLKKQGNKYLWTNPETGDVWTFHGKPSESTIDRMIKFEKEYEDSKTAPKWNSSSKYSSGFLNYIKDDVGKPEMVDDPELMELLIMEYEEYTKKSAYKTSR